MATLIEKNDSRKISPYIPQPFGMEKEEVKSPEQYRHNSNSSNAAAIKAYMKNYQ